MQPSHTLTATAAAGSSAAAAMAAAAGTAAADVTTLGPNAFSDLAEADVSPDQLFFHKFFNLSAVKSKAQIAAASKAAKAAAAAAKGDGSDSGSDSDSDGGEFGQQGIESDEDLESDEVDKALAAAEGVEDDGLGDPDVGYDYDSLLAAMAADGSSDGNSDDGASGSDGSSSEEGVEGGSDGSSAGGSDDGSDGSSSEGEGEAESEDGDWVLMEGAEDDAAAGTGSSKEDKKKKKKRSHDAGEKLVFAMRSFIAVNTLCQCWISAILAQYLKYQQAALTWCSVLQSLLNS
jgi:hypothetical protein